MESLGVDVMSVIISHLDIMDIMVFRCTNKGIRDTLLTYVKVTKDNNKLINEYKDIKITKTIDEKGVFRVRSIDGNLIGTSTFKGLNNYAMIFIDNNIEVSFMRIGNHSAIVNKTITYTSINGQLINDIEKASISLYYDDIKKITNDLINYNDLVSKRHIKTIMVSFRNLYKKEMMSFL